MLADPRICTTQRQIIGQTPGGKIIYTVDYLICCLTSCHQQYDMYLNPKLIVILNRWSQASFCFWHPLPDLPHSAKLPAVVRVRNRKRTCPCSLPRELAGDNTLRTQSCSFSGSRLQTHQLLKRTSSGSMPTLPQGCFLFHQRPDCSKGSKQLQNRFDRTQTSQA